MYHAREQQTTSNSRIRESRNRKDARRRTDMSEAMRAATHARHYAEPPQATDADGTRHWIPRAANFITAVSRAESGAVLARNNPDEYMVLLPPGTEVTVEAGGERVDSKGNTLIIVPPGQSR